MLWVEEAALGRSPLQNSWPFDHAYGECLTLERLKVFWLLFNISLKQNSAGDTHSTRQGKGLPFPQKAACAEALLQPGHLQAWPSQLWTTQSLGKDAAVTGLAVGKGHGTPANLVPLYWTFLFFPKGLEKFLLGCLQYIAGADCLDTREWSRLNRFTIHPDWGLSPVVTEQYKRQTEQSEGGISPRIKVVFYALTLRQGSEHLKPKEL